ncbi:MAG: hypothetical protein ACFB51_19415 [Anaerolineae bacterium]
MVDTQIQQRFVWRQPKVTERHFDLFDGSTQIGTIEWNNGQATAQMPTGAWNFKRWGLIKQYVEITDHPTNKTVGTLSCTGTAEGKLILQGGAIYFWRRPKVLRNVWTMLDAEGAVVYECQLHPSILGTGAEITVYQQDIAQLELLLSLGWYLTYMHSLDTD